jgi:DNA adenine methylase
MEALPKIPWSRSPRPFVKWAGGKGQLLKALEHHFPHDFRTYYEPFLGGGAVFFHLVKTRHRFSAVLSDINEELITAYRVVKEQVKELIQELSNHKAQYHMAPKEYYYHVRDALEVTTDIQKAARLIFLNKTCYNGLYRVNKEGKFNVPFGRYKNPKICDKSNLRTVSKVLNWSKARLLATDFQEATRDAGEHDFIYFDPPYQPVSDTASFTSYTHSGFPEEEQKRLCRWFRQLDKQGCQIVLSNSNTAVIENLYEGYTIQEVEAMRAISCKGNKRTGHTELIITNI